MITCINCGYDRVVRDGDSFACPACKYEWDVAHEQANAAYIASQGRKVAKPAPPPVEPEPDNKPDDEPELTIPTASEINAMKKDELIALAEQHEVELADDAKVDDIRAVLKVYFEGE